MVAGVDAVEGRFVDVVILDGDGRGKEAEVDTSIADGLAESLIGAALADVRFFRHFQSVHQSAF